MNNFPVCIRILSSENSAHSKYFSKISCNSHLFVQLGGLSKEGRAFEVGYLDR